MKSLGLTSKRGLNFGNLDAEQTSNYYLPTEHDLLTKNRVYVDDHPHRCGRVETRYRIARTQLNRLGESEYHVLCLLLC